MGQNKKILVYGSAIFGRVVAEHVVDCGYQFDGFIDDGPSESETLGTFAQVADSYDPEEYAIAMAIGYKHLSARRDIARRVRALGFRLPALIHPEAYVASSATIDFGCVVMARACIDVRVRLGALSVVWPAAVISHDSVLAGNTFVSPNATICGCCDVGQDVFIGAGATLVDHVCAPDGAFVKAGSVFSSRGN